MKTASNRSVFLCSTLLMSCFAAGTFAAVCPLAKSITTGNDELDFQDASFNSRQCAPSTNLFAISDQNKLLVKNTQGHILMVSKMADTPFENYYRPNVGQEMATNPGRDIWLTAAPQLQKFCQEYVAKNNLNQKKTCAVDVQKRLNKYLGLTPFDVNNSKPDEVVLMWVDPSDLFRPCPDPSISNSTCSTDSSNEFVKKNLDINNNSWPFTGKGYTYDWGSSVDAPFGASEYVLKRGSKVKVFRYETVPGYCNC